MSNGNPTATANMSFATDFNPSTHSAFQAPSTIDMKQQTNSALATVNMRQMAPLLETLDMMQERLFVLIGTSQDIPTAQEFIDESIQIAKRMANMHEYLVQQATVGEVDINNKEAVVAHAIDLALLEVLTHPKILWSVRRDIFIEAVECPEGNIVAKLHVLTKLHAICHRHHITIPGEIHRNIFQKFWDMVTSPF